MLCGLVLTPKVGELAGELDRELAGVAVPFGPIRIDRSPACPLEQHGAIEVRLDTIAMRAALNSHCGVTLTDHNVDHVLANPISDSHRQALLTQRFGDPVHPAVIASDIGD